MNSLLAVGARALTMVISLICGVLTTRMIMGEGGVETFALYTLLTTLPSLLTFTDLGSGAVLVNAVATSDDVRSDLKLRAQVTAVGRVLISFAGCAMALNVLLVVSGGWDVVFGVVGGGRGASLAAFYCITVFCCGIPFGIWTRIMLGQGRNHIVILLQGFISPLTMTGVWVMLRFGGRQFDPYLAIASYGASFLVAVLGTFLVVASTAPLIPAAARTLLQVRRHPSVRVMDVGWPMLAQMVTYPIAVGSQRYVIAQLGSPVDVAEYGVAGQVFFALNGLVMAGGLALWPYYARSRHRGEARRGPFVLSVVFATAAAAATAAVFLFGPWLFRFVTNGELVVRPSTIMTFGLMITMTAAVYPLGMFIMDKPGIRFQVIPTLCMAILSLCLSIYLTPILGIGGPLLGTSLALAVCQVVPYALYIGRHRARLDARAGEKATVR